MNPRRHIGMALLLAALLLGFGARTGSAQEADAPPRQKWSFSGPFGTYDPAQLQRGFKIYREVCSTCHSLKLLAFRNLADPGGPGFTDAQAATIAATFQVNDGPNDEGQMFQRSGKIADYFPPPFANDQAARAAASRCRRAASTTNIFRAGPSACRSRSATGRSNIPTARRPRSTNMAATSPPS
jgi:cytochrome c1